MLSRIRESSLQESESLELPSDCSSVSIFVKSVFTIVSSGIDRFSVGNMVYFPLKIF